MLVDTDVLVWFLRGNLRAARAIERLNSVTLSVVTYMELVQGTRDKAELRVVRATLAAWGPEVVQIGEDISTRASLYVERYAHSHGVRLADALIAATASQRGLEILTGNDKHYRMIPELSIRVFRPA